MMIAMPRLQWIFSFHSFSIYIHWSSTITIIIKWENFLINYNGFTLTNNSKHKIKLVIHSTDRYYSTFIHSFIDDVSDFNFFFFSIKQCLMIIIIRMMIIIISIHLSIVFFLVLLLFFFKKYLKNSFRISQNTSLI